MSFGRVTAEVTCDRCGLESEPVELSAGMRGLFSIEAVVSELRGDGWHATLDGDVICCDCLAEDAPPTSTAAAAANQDTPAIASAQPSIQGGR